MRGLSDSGRHPLYEKGKVIWTNVAKNTRQMCNKIPMEFQSKAAGALLDPQEFEQTS